MSARFPATAGGRRDLLAERGSRGGGRYLLPMLTPSRRCRSLLSSCLFAGGLAAQTTTTIACAADNSLYQAPLGDASNGAGTGLFVGMTSAGLIRRAVLRFDVAAALPAGARVIAAQLTVNVANAPNTNPEPMTGHRLLQAWGEGTSVATAGGGNGGPATNGDATWLYRFYNVATPTAAPTWTTPGGDFVATPSFAASMPPLGLVTTGVTAVAAQDVQSWLDSPAANFGWLLRSGEITNQTTRRLDSRESSGVRPTLAVTWLAPGQNGTWGTGCAGGFGTFTTAWVGAPSGGSTMQIAHTAAAPLSVGVDFFALALDPVGLPLLPGCAILLPLAAIVPGPSFTTDGSGAGASPFAVPNGFPGYLIACQAAVLDGSAPGFTVSNAALTVLQ